MPDIRDPHIADLVKRNGFKMLACPSPMRLAVSFLTGSRGLDLEIGTRNGQFAGYVTDLLGLPEEHPHGVLLDAGNCTVLFLARSAKSDRDFAGLVVYEDDQMSDGWMISVEDLAAVV